MRVGGGEGAERGFEMGSWGRGKCAEWGRWGLGELEGAGYWVGGEALGPGEGRWGPYAGSGSGRESEMGKGRSLGAISSGNEVEVSLLAGRRVGARLLFWIIFGASFIWVACLFFCGIIFEMGSKPTSKGICERAALAREI